MNLQTTWGKWSACHPGVPVPLRLRCGNPVQLPLGLHCVDGNSGLGPTFAATWGVPTASSPRAMVSSPSLHEGPT